MFEFLCGDVPFGHHTEDPLEIYESIINDRINYPANLIDIYAQDLMDQLMNKYNPESRLGGPSFKCLKENPWFSRINWVFFFIYLGKISRKIATCSLV